MNGTVFKGNDVFGSMVGLGYWNVHTARRLAFMQHIIHSWLLPHFPSMSGKIAVFSDGKGIAGGLLG